MSEMPFLVHDESDYDCELSPAELGALGDLNRLRVLHLAAALPFESFALASLGATVVVTSATHEDVGNNLAVDRGLDVTFLPHDLADLPDKQRDDQFHVVYAGPTTLAWIENLNDWAVDVAEALLPGGAFVMYDEHPDSRELLPPDDEPDPEIAGDTVGDEEPLVDVPTDQSWTLDELQGSLADHGLLIERLDPLFGPQRFLTTEDTVTDGADDAGVPTAFVLVATRPALPA